MVIKVLGSGCANCTRLEDHARQAIERAGLDAEVVKVQGMAEIMAYGIMSTPGLVVDEEVKVAGRVPSVDEIVDLLTA
jgi:small redox-active disulfide protein 2